MRVTRISVLAVLALVAGLLGVPPALADQPPGFPIFPPNSSTDRPVNVEPITRTADSVVWHEPRNGGLWMQGTWGKRLAEWQGGGTPVRAGDLLSTYGDGTREFLYQTIGPNPTSGWLFLPTDLTYLASTDTGYLAQRGTGPYELVFVDVLHGADPVVFGTTTISQSSLKTSALGALGESDIPGQYLYFAYSAPGSAQTIQTPANSTCTLTTTRLYCAWSDGATNHLSRLPLTGDAGDQIDVAASSVVEDSAGIAFTSVSGTTTTLSAWALNDAAATTILDGTFPITSSIAAAADDPSTILVNHPGALGDAGIYAVPLTGGTPTLVLATTSTVPRTATDVAIAPGEVAWVDDRTSQGNVMALDLSGGTPQAIATPAAGDTLSIAGARTAYTSGTAPLGSSELQDGGTVEKLNDQGVVSQLSGDRLLMQSRVVTPGSVTTPWALKDLRSGGVTALPNALSYHLWGERLARLDADGSVWVLDLRTGAAPVRLRDASAGVTGGTVLIAGDDVGWQVTSSIGGAATSEVMVRNLATMAPATSLSTGRFGLKGLTAMSTGYAVGYDDCPGGRCYRAAVPLPEHSSEMIGTPWWNFDQAPSTSHQSIAIDGNNVAYVSSAGLPTVGSLDPYNDPPRLLASPGATTFASTTQPWTAHVVASRVLDSCEIDIRDASQSLVRTLSCLEPHAAAMVTWDSRNDAGRVVPAGSYTWQIVGTKGRLPLTDYDGSTTALSGSITTVPAIKEVYPVDGFSLDMPQTDNITASFNVPVTGVSGTTFVLRGPTGAAVPAVVSYNATTRTATLDPTSPLLPHTYYTATLTGDPTGVHATDNRPVPTMNWTLTTGPGPQVIAETPQSGTGPPVSTNITARFDQPVNLVNDHTFYLLDYANHYANVPAIVTYDAATRTATLDPVADLAPDHHYGVGLDGRYIGNDAGNPLGFVGWDFTTGPAPTLIARRPGVNATGAQINGNITATFSEPVQGVGPSTVVLTSPAGTKLPALVTYNPIYRTVTLNPIATLARNVRYRVTFLGGPTGIRDIAGNQMAKTWWMFTTGTR